MSRQLTLGMLLVVLIVGVDGTSVWAKNSGKAAHSGKGSSPFVGHWTYRSFRNDPDPVGDVQRDPQKLVKLLFAEAEWVIEETNDRSLKGQLVFGPDQVMDLTGVIRPASKSHSARVHINGKGRPGTATEHLFYDYDGELAFTWPNGVDQRPAIVGSVIRVKPHDGGAAGYVASFIAVKRDSQ
jgi:hypothetical protein